MLKLDSTTLENIPDSQYQALHKIVHILHNFPHQNQDQELIHSYLQEALIKRTESNLLVGSYDYSDVGFGILVAENGDVVHLDIHITSLPKVARKKHLLPPFSSYSSLIRQINKLEYLQTLRLYLTGRSFMPSNLQLSNLELRLNLPNIRFLSFHILGHHPQYNLRMSEKVYSDLRVLYLTGLPSNIHYPSRSFLKKFVNLERLMLNVSKSHVDKAGFIRLIEFLRYFPRLRSLIIIAHRKVILPKAIGMLKNLEVLFLQDIVLEDPRSLGNLEKLKSLYLEGVPLESLPVEICRIPKLKELIAINCELQSIPKQISNLVLLEVLVLGENYLTSLPSSITKLSKVKTLYLEKNRFKEIPFDHLEEFEFINLRGNKLGDDFIEKVKAMIRLDPQISSRITLVGKKLNFGRGKYRIRSIYEITNRASSKYIDGLDKLSILG